MITEVCVLIGGALGALAGAAISSTEKGQEIDDILSDAFDGLKDEVSGALLDGVHDVLEGNEW
ncbi:MAG: hypothetical protein J6X78_06785 [Treponema sp.]|nr:hypothetical protein [Treponema sp.]